MTDTERKILEKFLSDQGYEKDKYAVDRDETIKIQERDVVVHSQRSMVKSE